MPPTARPDAVANESAAAKDRFTSLDTLALLRELRTIGRAFVDKAFDLPGGAIGLTLRSPTAGRRELKLVPGRYAALLALRQEHPEEPGPLARDLRRLLSGAALSDLPDPAGERYLEIVLQRPDSPDPITLAVELFGTGNLIVARGSRIVAVAHAKTWAHRTVRIGAEYVRPPGRGSPWARTVAELAASLGQSRTDRASTLAARLALGGPLAEEILARAALEGALPATTDAVRSAERIHRALGELLGELGEQPRGYLYLRGDQPLDVAPIRASRWGRDPGVRLEETATFSEAAERFFASVTPVATPAPGSAARNRHAELERQAAQQREAIALLESEAADRKGLADAVYSHFADLDRQRNELLEDGARGTMPLKAGARVVPLRIEEPLHDGAQRLYAEAKELQRKLAGAREALAETEHRLRTVSSESAAAPVVTPAPVARPLWFERYRWFVSSEGLLVVGGRDAASNDLLVRRYLRPKDRYVHADVHGAPSVVVKHSETTNEEPGDATMAEAGQLSVAFSRAWKAGLASASAFWVLPDQVSKTGASGEFVARGAFVIHGTKRVLSDLPTELAIGTIEVQGRTLWCVAPPAPLRARGRVRFLITPGEERDRASLEVELASALGLPRSRLQSLLPAGGLMARPA